MSWGNVAVIGASAVGGAIAANQSRTSGKIKFADVPETSEAETARQRLLGLSQRGLPEQPLREIAGVQPLGEERTLARKTATELAQPQDIFSLPEVQGIIQQTTETGNLLVNRLGRMLKSAGALTATTGRDVLGRTVSAIQGRIAAALAPFASEERERRRLLIPQLEGLGLAEEEPRRATEQARLDAEFNKLSIEARETQDFEIPLLQSLIGLQPSAIPFIPGGGSTPNTFTQVSPIIAQLLASQINRQQPTRITPGQTPPDTGALLPPRGPGFSN